MKNKKNKSEEEDRPEYWVRYALSKFGYEIMKRTPEFKRVFHTSDKDQAKQALKDFQKKDSTDLIPKKEWEPMYLKLEEKHGSPVCLINNEDELYSVALRIVEQREEENYYYFHSDCYYKPVTEEEIAAIKNEKVLNFALEQKKLYEEELKEKKDADHQKFMLDAAIKNKDGKLAWAFMKERMGHQYENFVYESFRSL